jgi:hypothetical protein
MSDASMEDSRKYATIARAFLFKVMDCIYLLRCPAQVPDFLSDDSFGFSLDIPSSQSLRAPLNSSMVHGWFKIDISISGTSEIIERWYLMHLHVDRSEPIPTVPGGPKGLKVYTYRSLCKCLRSIYSLLNCLPAIGFAKILAQFTIVKRNLVGVSSRFEKFPLKLDSFCEDEVGELRFGPVVTPIGKVLVICEHRLDLSALIPKAIRTAPHYVFPRPQAAEQSEVCEREFGENDSPGSGLQLAPLPTANLSSFVAPPQLDGFIVVDDSMCFPEEGSAMPIGEFMRLIDRTERMQPGDPPSAQAILDDFAQMKRELADIISPRRPD